jgi:predicted metal-dependent phosphotriesterase family hydrolase
VRGPVDAATLGRVLMNEHVFVFGAAAAPNWHYNHISDDVLPAMRERGVTEDQITTMLVDNPRHYFGS